MIGLRSDKNTPSHGHHSHSACLTDKIQRKLASSLDFEDFTLTYKAKMKVLRWDARTASIRSRAHCTLPS